MSWTQRRWWISAAAGWLILGTSSTAGAAIVLSTNFNSENGGVPALNYANFADFKVTAGSVDLIGNGSFDFYPGNGLYVDMNGTTGVSGTLTSKQTFAPGTYQLTFDIGNNPSGGSPNSMTVMLDGFSQTFARTGTVPLQLVTLTFTTTTAAPLIFTTPAGDSDNVGIVIDSISLATVTAAAPEPSTTVLAGSAGAALAVRAWRRRRRHA